MSIRKTWFWGRWKSCTMDMEPWRESATPSMSRYREGGFVGRFSRSLRRDTSEVEESMMLMVMVQVLGYEVGQFVGICV